MQRLLWNRSGRVINKDSQISKLEIIKKESELAVPTKHVYLTIKDGLVMADAGIDESNANGGIILSPKDSFLSAAKIRSYLKKTHGLKNLGIIISDSFCLPLRAGVIGIALGYAGFKGLRDYCQKRDIFGRPFEFSRVDVADSLATAATLAMGEGNEQKPLAIISGAPVEYRDKVMKNELNRQEKGKFNDVFSAYP